MVRGESNLTGENSVLSRKALLALICGLLFLNFLTLLTAYTQISNIDSGCCSNQPLAKDFSGVYIGAWRLFHDPAHVYTHGYVADGEVHIYPQPEQYKYLPSFLLAISPVLLVQYQQAIVIYDIVQFSLLPLIGILIYSLTKEKGWAITIIAETIALLLPAPAPGWGFSVAYFWQWKEGQSKVFETLLLTLSFYLGSQRRHTLSGVCLGLAFFDPRFAIVSLPLFIMYNVEKALASVRSLILTLVVSNVPLFYPSLGLSFLQMVFSTGITTLFYPYALIPLLSVGFLTFVNYNEVRKAATDSFAKLRLREFGS
jgi:hypothetical protein